MNIELDIDEMQAIIALCRFADSKCVLLVSKQSGNLLTKQLLEKFLPLIPKKETILDKLIHPSK